MTDDQLNRQLTGLSRLAQIEWEARQAAYPSQVCYIAANDTHRIVAYDHALLWRARKGQITVVSGGLKVESTAPQIVWFSKLAKFYVKASATATDKRTDSRIGKANAALEGALPAPKSIRAQELPPSLRDKFPEYIAAHALWVPMTGPRGRLEGGLILLRKTEFNAAECRTLQRLGNAYGSALTALSLRSAPSPRGLRARHIGAGVALLAALLLMFLRVPITILAEAKIAPVHPTLISAPIDGVIASIDIEPNQRVAEGQSLLQFDTTELYAAKEIAARRLAVLRADSWRAEAQAFTDPKARAEISALRAKLLEGEAELAYAQERLRNARLASPAQGVALLDDTNEWVGRPVKTGERIMVIANPQQALLEIEIAVEDALYAAPGARVDFFLATKPAAPVPARLTKVSYGTRLQPDQSTKFIAEARFQDVRDMPRLGLTGTARIEGVPVSLGFMLLRKPLAKLRRLLGI